MFIKKYFFNNIKNCFLFVTVNLMLTSQLQTGIVFATLSEAGITKSNLESGMPSNFLSNYDFKHTELPGTGKHLEELSQDKDDKSELNQGLLDQLTKRKWQAIFKKDNEFSKAVYSAYEILPEHGGGKTFAISITLNDNYRESPWSLLNACSDGLEDLSAMFGIPDVAKDLTGERLKSSLWHTQEIRAQWKSVDLGLNFSCYVASKPDLPKEDYEADLSKNDKKNIQAALNFFGFKAGKVDGVFGRKTLRAGRKFKECINQIPSDGYTPSEKTTLISIFNKISKLQSEGDCEDLLAQVPRVPLMDFISVSFKPINQLENV